jgi:hypothetical protein
MQLTDIIRDIRNQSYSNDDLNMIIEAVKYRRTLNAQRVRRSIQIGDTVQFTGRNGPTQGVLEQVKIKKAIVKVGQTRWNVPLSMLEAV